MESPPSTNYFIEATKGKLYVHNGYLFKLKANRTSSSYWVCKRSGCRATLNLDNGDNRIVSANGPHSHEPDPAEIRAMKFVERLKKRARRERSTPVSRMYREEVAKENADVCSILPSYDSLKTTLYTLRATAPQTLPQTSQVDPRLAETSDGATGQNSSPSSAMKTETLVKNQAACEEGSEGNLPAATGVLGDMASAMERHIQQANKRLRRTNNEWTTSAGFQSSTSDHTGCCGVSMAFHGVVCYCNSYHTRTPLDRSYDENLMNRPSSERTFQQNFMSRSLPERNFEQSIANRTTFQQNIINRIALERTFQQNLINRTIPERTFEQNIAHRNFAERNFDQNQLNRPLPESIFEQNIVNRTLPGRTFAEICYRAYAERNFGQNHLNRPLPESVFEQNIVNRTLPERSFERSIRNRTILDRTYEQGQQNTMSRTFSERTFEQSLKREPLHDDSVIRNDSQPSNDSDVAIGGMERSVVDRHIQQENETLLSTKDLSTVKTEPLEEGSVICEDDVVTGIVGAVPSAIQRRIQQASGRLLCTKELSSVKTEPLEEDAVLVREDCPARSSSDVVTRRVPNLISALDWHRQQVMNKFLTNVGVSDEWSMIDVIDLDDDHLENLPKKVKAVLLLFPKGDQHEEHCQSEQEVIENDGQVVSDRVYFMKLDSNNASGTVSIIHAVANADDELELADDSSLKEFLERTKDMSQEERGQELEMDETLCCVHDTVAKEGQTEAPEADEETNLHFITFVAVDEQLYELDAHKNFPVNHGSTSMETLMKDAVAACKKFMERDPENVNFSIMALVGGASAETEEEEIEE